MNKIIVENSVEVIERLVSRNPADRLEIGGSAQAFILKDELNETLVIAIFSNPRTKEAHRLYTSELIALWSRSDAPRELVSEVVKEYLASGPWDCFVSTAVARGNEVALIDAGFSLPAVERESKKVHNALEWLNPSLSYYVYRISSNEEPSYYIGRRAIKIAGALESDCMADGYMGSGGRAFKEWMNIRTPESLIKEILSLHFSWSEVVEAEHEAIGGAHKKDPLCLNYLPGGVGVGRSVAHFTIKNCETHGETLHNGNACGRCSAARGFSLLICSIHGETKHRGSSCEKCNGYYKWTEGNCSLHGARKFVNGVCAVCRVQDKLSTRNCPSHGEVIHMGNACSTCTAESAVSEKICPTHGSTKHQGNTCSRCNAQRSVAMKLCSTHGKTKHQGINCMKCNAAEQLTERNCATHGLVLHKGNSCTLCTAQKAVSLKTCPTHGETKHQGNSCSLCNSQKSVSMVECPKHGFTKHQGATCNKCNAQRSVVEKECPTHGLAKFQGSGCVKCRNAALVTMKDCPTHGPWKHRGKTCYACMSDRRKATFARERL